MKKSVFLLFVIVISTIDFYGQASYMKIIGRNGSDLFYNASFTYDNGLLFSGNISGGYSLTRCNYFADTLWTSSYFFPYRSFNGSSALADGRIAFAGYDNSVSYENTILFVTDSTGHITDSVFYYTTGWGIYGLDVYAMPDSGLMISAYDDGKTCSNLVDFHYLDKTLNEVWYMPIGVCDASLYFSDGFEGPNQRMHFLKLLYYEADSLGNWYHNVPLVFTKDLNANTIFDSLYFIIENFYGITDVSDGGALVYGQKDTLGTQKILMMKLSQLGDVEWMKVAGTNYDDAPFRIIEMNDGGFGIFSTQTLPNNTSDVTFTRTDSAGNVLSTEIYGSAGNETALDMLKDSTGGFVLLARTNSFGFKRNMIIRLDSLGHLNSTYSINSTSHYFCDGDTAALTVTPAAASYLWSTGETTQNILVTASGNYSVLVTTVSGSVELTPSFDIYVNGLLDTHFLNDTVLSVCIGDDAELELPWSTGNSYTWYIDSVLISNANQPIYITNQTGNYYCIVSSSCSIDTTSIVSVTVHDKPIVPQLSADPAAQVCNGTPINLVSAVQGDTVHWDYTCYGHNYHQDFGTGDTLILTQPGNYFLNAYTQNQYNCFSADTSINVTIDNTPQVDFYDSIQDICIPGISGVTYTSSEQFGKFYQYENGILLSITTIPSQFSVSSNGVLTVSMENTCGSDTDSIVVIAHPYITPSIFPLNPIICSGQPVLVSSLTPGICHWSPGGSIDSTLLISVPGFYSMYITDSPFPCINGFGFNVDTVSDLVPAINLQDTFLCPGQQLVLFPGSFQFYLWNTGSTDTTITVIHPGFQDSVSYYVNVSSLNNCSAMDSVKIIFDLCLGENDVIPSRIKVYPNPASSLINFESAVLNSSRISIYNYSGQLIAEEKNPGKIFILHVSNYVPGFYFYVIDSEDGVFKGSFEIIK